MEKQHKLAMSQAWHTAALPLTKKFPPLSKLLGEEKFKKAQTPEEMLGAMRSLVAATKHLTVQ